MCKNLIGGIEIAGHDHTWYVVSEESYNGEKYFLLENEYYGEDIEGLIVDSNYNVVLGNVYNGWSDFDEYLDINGGTSNE